MRPVIAYIADGIRSVSAPSSIEEIARFIIAQAIEDEDRILETDEIVEIVDDVVRGEDIPVLKDTLDNGKAYMTDIEWDNIPDERKVIDTDGDESIVIDGGVHKVVISKDHKVSNIANKICSEIEANFNLYKTSSGVDMNFNCYHLANDFTEYACPVCGSFDVNAVWYDAKDIVLVCTDCGHEWQQEMNEECATVEELTTEDYEIVDNEDVSLFGSVYFDSETSMFVWEVWENGELIFSDTASSIDEVDGIFAGLRASYEEIVEGLILHDTETGIPETVVDVDEYDVVTSRRTASRGLVATEICFGKKISDRSNLHIGCVYAGDVYRDAIGNTIRVVSAGADVMFVEAAYDNDKMDFKTDYMMETKEKFLDKIERGCFTLM